MNKEELKIGLALSGGGVRAAVYHLGVLTYLAKENLLEQVEVVSSVSGGSILTGLIFSIAGNEWPSSKKFLELLPEIKKTFKEKSLQQLKWKNILLKPIWFFNSLESQRSEILVEHLKSKWGIKSKLSELPKHPKWIINSTNYQTGKNWLIIPHHRMGDYIFGYTDCNQMSMARAMASSAAFPFLIDTVELDTKDFKWYKFNKEGGIDGITPSHKTINLWDGGVYDNLGLEQLFKIDTKKYREGINFILVSDAGPKASEVEYPTTPFLKQKDKALRLVDIMMDQNRALRDRVLINYFKNNKNSGIYTRIGNTSYRILKNSGWSEDEISALNLDSNDAEYAKLAADHPTDLKALSEKEYIALHTHGEDAIKYSFKAYLNDYQ